MVQLLMLHNPSCGSCRTALSTLQEAGHEPQLRKYLREPLGMAELQAIARLLGGARHFLRIREADAMQRAGITADSPDQDIISAMAREPILVERPVVLRFDGAAAGQALDISAANAALVARPGARATEILGAS